jgi:hypothetical protein
LWYVVWGGRNIEDNHHTVSEAERFAMDVLIAQDGSSHTGDGTNLTDYYCYGREVLAPGPGVVVKVHDNEPDQQPGKRDPQNPLGNAVMIDHGNGEFSLLAHMQPGTIRVKVGDTVETQTVLGLVGNSGNTTEPHIHYHVMDGPDMETAEGLPVRFYSIVVDGEIVSWVEPTRGDFTRRTEEPLFNTGGLAHGRRIGRQDRAGLIRISIARTSEFGCGIAATATAAFREQVDADVDQLARDVRGNRPAEVARPAVPPRHVFTGQHFLVEQQHSLLHGSSSHAPGGAVFDSSLPNCRKISDNVTISRPVAYPAATPCRRSDAISGAL